MIGTILVIAKAPLPGRAKTRLAPRFGFDGAARIAAAALADTMAAVAQVPARQRILVLDGPSGPWVPVGVEVIAQGLGGLDARLSEAFDAVAGDGPAVLVGMDTPQFRPAMLEGFDPNSDDACLGMAADGGFWTIGFADPGRARECIAGVPMSTDNTGAIQLSRLLAAGLSVRLLQTLCDVDTPDIAAQVADQFPETLFAATVRDLVAVRAA
jgi:glycosyltransferase A (GT-A) superfamily protein (DUF2064 family)